MLDCRDKAIVAELVRSGRASNVDLARKVGLSPTACARRQKSLEEAGIITGYQASLDLRRLGFTSTVMVRVALNSQNEEALRKFESAVTHCASVLRCLLMSGSDDYLLTVLVRDIEDYEHVHRSQLSRLPYVARIESSFALREVINRSAPPAAFR